MSADYELVVVGGGIHGVGVAQAAAAAGHSVLLLEERELAAGTSSRSSKLVHGGLRYLESAQFKLVHESLAERALLLELAPELVKLVPFLIPVYQGMTRGPWQIRAGLSLYALLGKLHPHARFRKLPRAEWAGLDGLRTQGLRAVYEYFDGQTDDAELTRAVMASACELGAELWQPARLLSARRGGEGYRLRIRLDEREEELETNCLVNAAGPWIEEVRASIKPPPPGLPIELVAGTHIELPGSLDAGIYYTEAPLDRRAVFSIPWKGHTLVGTTETPLVGPPEAVSPLPEEVEYLQQTFAHHFPGRSLELVDAWAGVRVLPSAKSSAFHRTRETKLVADEESRPRLIGIYGGKLTTYRATAEKVLRRLSQSLPARARRADTKSLRLASGSEG